MLAHLTRRLTFLHRTREQRAFLEALPRMKFSNDEQLVENIRAIYEKREFLEECEAFSEVNNRIENYLLKNTKCTVAHLQCYYKLKEMRMVTVPFKHNLHRKYYNYLLDSEKQIKNEHMEKYLWFLYDQGRFERELFRDAAETHTLNLFQIYEYMNSLADLPTWQPYIRIVNMLAFLGHDIAPHNSLGTKKTIDRIEHKYYPYIARLFTQEQMLAFQKGKRFDNPYLTYLCDQYIIKNCSKYDSYLQRVEFIELEQQYERLLDIMSWSEFPAFLDLVVANYEVNGGNDEIENRVTELFFRLCEHDDLDLETITSVFTSLLKHQNFMVNRRFPIITRCTDSIFKKGIQDFFYLPAEAFMSLLQSSKKIVMDSDSRQYLQKFICHKVSGKTIWNEGEVQRMKELVQQEEIAGGMELLIYLNEIAKAD